MNPYSVPSRPTILADAPPVPGFSFRAPQLPADLPGLAAVRAACAPYDGVDPSSVVERLPSAEDLGRMLVPSDSFDPSRDLLVVTVGEQVAGYGSVSWWTETDGTRLYLTLGWVVPEWRRVGIGTALLHWAEARCRELHALHPAQAPSFYGANASETEHDATGLVLNEGYAVAFTVLEMGLDDLSPLRTVALPPGFVTRPLLESDLPALFESMNGCYVDHPFGDIVRFEDWVKEQNDLRTWYVAWDERSGEIAGQVQTLIRAGRPEVEEVSVRAPFRRRGLARALLARGLDALREQGVTSVRLRTVLENPQQAWRVYESVGFRVLKRFPRYRKGIGD